MTRDQATRFCDEINSIHCGYVADVVDVTKKRQSDYPAGVRIRHAISGSEVGYAGNVSAGRYMVDSLRRKCTTQKATESEFFE